MCVLPALPIFKSFIPHAYVTLSDVLVPDHTFTDRHSGHYHSHLPHREFGNPKLWLLFSFLNLNLSFHLALRNIISQNAVVKIYLIELQTVRTVMTRA